MNNSIIAGVAGANFWIGELGLNPRPTNFTTMNDPQTSLLAYLRESNMIPSLSWSYTAGAPYRLKKVLGSLVFGGYDSSRFSASNVTFQFGSDQSRDLTLGLQSITAEMSGAKTSLMSSGIDILIDSSVAQIYLPELVCRAFEETFGLIYNTTVGLYLVNETLHSNLLSQNPMVAFKLGNTAVGGPSIDITLPYASFDLQVMYPMVEGDASWYFPLQRAANQTQYTLGRTFLQEAYLIVDYERNNFSISPCDWDAAAVQHIETILDPKSYADPDETDSDRGTDTSGLGRGAIAGISLGVLVLIVLAAGTTSFFAIRRRKRLIQGNCVIQPPKEGVVESEANEKYGVHELEIPSEVQVNNHEVEGDLRFTALQAELEDPTVEIMGRPVHEMPGSDVPEMMAEDAASAGPGCLR